jgi:catechol 1,2-dioxygenase
MIRREFIKSSALCAFAVSTLGYVRFDGKNYIGDCATTTDILGPFYRPDSPVRNNLIIRGEGGKIVELSGAVNHQDCITPYRNAKVELWHCDNNGVYDNSSDAFRYRGTTFTDEYGGYTFHTVLPVPYDVGNGTIRPAHFHMMITADGYQPLVTQLYFSGDEHIETDASAAAATGRILEVEEHTDGTAKVYFTVNMAKTLSAEPSSIDKLTGEYIHENNPGSSMVFFNSGNSLWRKNEVFGIRFNYVGNNTFEYPGTPPGRFMKLHFELLPSGSVKLTMIYNDSGLNEQQQVFIKSS